MKYIKLIMLMTGIVSMQMVAGQNGDQPTDNIVFLLRQMEHFTQVNKSVASVKEPRTSDLKPDQTVIILCGEMLKEIHSEEMKKQLKIAASQGTIVYACGLSLAKFGIARDSLPPMMRYVDNGLIKTLELQKKGYLSIEL